MNATAPFSANISGPVAPPQGEIKVGGSGFLNGDSIWNSALALFLAQVMVILATTRLIGKLFSYAREPMVVAEMVAGILLGPSALGRIPGWQYVLFPASSISLLSIVSNLGLVLFMFVVGLELDVKLLRKSGRSATISSVVGVIVPFIFGVPLAFALNSPEFHSTSWLVFYFFISIIVGISALPVLARIISEYNFLTSPLGVFTMSATTIDDVIGWPLLALVIALAGISSYISLLWIALAASGIVLIVFFIVRPILGFIHRKTLRQKSHSQAVIFAVLFMVILVAWLSEIVGITSLIGAFAVGLIIPRQGTLVDEMANKVEDLITVIFLPIFFTVSGLRTQFGLVDRGELWGLTFLIISLSIIGKMSGCILSARWVAKLTWLDSIIFGILMNTKGLVALISLNLGLSAKIISPKLFTMCVIMVIFNTIITGPLVNLIYRAFKKTDMQADQRAADPEAASGTQHIVICVSSEKTAPYIVKSVALLLHDATKFKTSLVRISDKSDRPSEYMNKFNFLAYRRDKVVRLAMKAAESTNLHLSAIKYQSIEKDVASDIVQISANVGATLLVLGVQSVSSLIRKRQAIISSVLSRAPCDCCIVIGKEKRFAQTNQSTDPQQHRIILPLIGTSELSAHDQLAIDTAVTLAEAPGVTLAILVLSDGDSSSSHLFARVYSQQNTRIQVLFASTEQKHAEMLEAELSSENLHLAICGYDSSFLPKLTSQQSKPVLVTFSRKAAPPSEGELARLLPASIQRAQSDEEEIIDDESEDEPSQLETEADSESNHTS